MQTGAGGRRVSGAPLGPGWGLECSWGSSHWTIRTWTLLRNWPQMFSSLFKAATN